MTMIRPWKPHESSDLVLRLLAEGKCVALPTESTYELVASALHPAAIASLQRLTGAHLPAIVLGDYANLFDWLPFLEGAGSRLFRKLGPGPVTVLADGGFSFGVFPRLPEGSRRLLVQDGRIAVRWPRHPIWEELREANLPLLSVPFDQGVNAERLAGLDVACIIDAGETEFGGAPSLVRADGRRCQLTRAGGLTKEQFDTLAVCRILFICTGNTCRSPMAEALCKKLLADQLGCKPAELNERGFCVESAGLAASLGSPASPDGVRVASDYGADLGAHRSRMATMEMLLWTDYLFTMTASHAHALLPAAHIAEPRLLSPAGEDVADPIGGALEDYRTCAEQIIQYLQQRLPELLES